VRDRGRALGTGPLKPVAREPASRPGKVDGDVETGSLADLAEVAVVQVEPRSVGFIVHHRRQIGQAGARPLACD
jgi:hypothetical protein